MAAFTDVVATSNVNLCFNLGHVMKGQQKDLEMHVPVSSLI